MLHEVGSPRSAIAEKACRLQGPILVLGASGFIGANLMRSLMTVRGDVFGTTTRKPAWRLADLPDDHVRMVDLLIESNLESLLATVRPRTIFRNFSKTPDIGSSESFRAQP